MPGSLVNTNELVLCRLSHKICLYSCLFFTSNTEKKSTAEKVKKKRVELVGKKKKNCIFSKFSNHYRAQMAVSKWFAFKILPTSVLAEFFKYFLTSEQIAVIQVEGKKRDLASVMSISRKNWQHISCT